jgi:2-polyprenyl-6-methoxyphenol hydroxylase-like FAD-dependent oxidoreductase
MPAPRLAIIGAGVGGMAAALALVRAGHNVTLFERFNDPRPLGAGLLLQPTGQAALQALGLLEEVKERSAKVSELVGRTPGGRKILELNYARLRPDLCGLGVHRGVLFNALYSSVRQAPIHQVLGAEVVDVDPARGEILLREGRREGPFELIVIADGAHSRLREKLFGPQVSQVYSWGALWTVIPDPEDLCTGALRQVYSGASVMIGLLPVGAGPEGTTPQCALFWSLPVRDEPRWRQAGLASWSSEISRYWPEAGEMSRRVCDPEAVSFAVYRDSRLPSPRQGRIVLIGDAAHSTSPQLGQGANLALVDGLVLASSLSERPDDIDQALKMYIRSRKRLIAWTQIMSRMLTPAFQSSVPGMGWARDIALPLARRIPALERLMLRTLAGEQTLGV